MPPRATKTTRELVALYRRAGRGEHNLAAFFREHPALAEHLGVVDLEHDDVEVALRLAPVLGRYQQTIAHGQASERSQRAAEAARALSVSARHRGGRIDLDGALLLGDLLADGTTKFISFDLPTGRVSIARAILLRARGALRDVSGITAAVDERGLHLGWRHGRGGLNFLPHLPEHETASLVVDLRAGRRSASTPMPPGDVLAELVFM